MGVVGPAACAEVKPELQRDQKRALAQPSEEQVNTPPNEAVKPMVPESGSKVEESVAPSSREEAPEEKVVRASERSGPVREKKKSESAGGGRVAENLKTRLRQPDVAERNNVSAQLLVGALIAALVGAYSIASRKKGEGGVAKVPAA